MSGEPHDFVWLDRRELQIWGTLIVLVGVFNICCWIRGDAGWLAMVAAVVEVALMVGLLARAVHFVRANKSGHP